MHHWGWHNLDKCRLSFQISLRKNWLYEVNPILSAKLVYNSLLSFRNSYCKVAPNLGHVNRLHRLRLQSKLEHLGVHYLAGGFTFGAQFVLHFVVEFRKKLVKLSYKASCSRFGGDPRQSAELATHLFVPKLP